jgi:uncharacterized protein
MKEQRVSFPSGNLILEGILLTPQSAGPFPAVIICHPHPLYGGSMDNNVVNSLSETLTRASLATFKFNFRGVGRSQGEFGQGMGEQEDVEAAIAFVSKVTEVDSERIGLAGYSAGAGFGLAASFDDDRIKALAGISPPLTKLDFKLLRSWPKPKFIILGSRDHLIPIANFLEFCQNLPEPKECQSIEGADHFWRGYESTLATKVVAFFIRVL